MLFSSRIRVLDLAWLASGYAYNHLVILLSIIIVAHLIQTGSYYRTCHTGSSITSWQL